MHKETKSSKGSRNINLYHPDLILHFQGLALQHQVLHACVCFTWGNMQVV